MNKLFTKIVGVALGLTMAIGVGVAVGSNVKGATPVHATAATLSLSSGSGGTGTVTYKNTDYDGVKIGASGGKTGTAAFTVASGSTSCSFFAAGWNGKSVTLSVSISSGSISPTSVSLTADSGVSGSANNFTISGTTDSNFKKDFTLSNVTSSATISITTSSTEKRAAIWNANYEAATKTLSSIAVTSSSHRTFAKNDTFVKETITATYSDSSTADVTSSASFSGYNMSTTGSQTVSVSYTEGGTTKTATYTITVNDPRTVTGLTVFDEDTNELADEDEITLTASSGSSISTDVMCVVTYSPSGSDGNVSITSASGAGFSVTTEDNELYTLTFSANGNHVITFEASEDDSFAITVTYIVSGLPNVTTVTDTIDNALTGVGTGTTYTDWSGKKGQSDAVYAGRSAGDKSTVQLRTSGNNEGVVTTQSSGGVATVITLTFNNNTTDSRRVDVYGKNTPYSAASDLFNDLNKGTLIGYATYDKNGTGETVYTIDVSSDKTKQFSYIGIRSNSSALYLDSIKITWSIEQEIIDVLEYIYIDGSLTTTSYTEGQTISLSGLTVYGHYTTAGDVSLMGKTGLTFGCSPTTATSTSLDEITVNASYEGKNDSETYEISVSADSVTALGWGTRGYESGDYFLSGKTLSECIDTSKWTFSPTWASGISKPAPSFGTGSDNVHVGLYSSSTPASETASALTNSYTFTTEDDGKYLVAFYKGTHSIQNKQLFITESLNSIIEPASGEAGWNLVRDASYLAANDRVAIVTAEANTTSNSYYAMSTTQNSTNRGAEVVDVADDTLTITNNVQEFTLEVGTTSGTWSFNTGSGYIYAASSSNNHLKTESNKSANSSFTVSITNSTGVAALTAQGTYSHNQLKFNYNGGSPLFSCYSNGQSAVAIYKYSEPMDKEIADTNLKVQHVVVEYAKAFNAALEEVCVAYGSTNTDDLSTAWSLMDTQFTNWFNGSTKSLSEDEKTFAKSLFANAKYAERDSASNDSLQAMLGKYDEILSHYDYEDFLSDDAGRGAAPQKAHPVLLNIIGENTNTVVTIVIISMISVTAIGGYLFLRKRKEN